MVLTEEPKTIDPRVKRTRQLITDAFISLLVEKDFDAITIGDVASRATVNRATFYSHFDDKYKLLDYFIGQETKKAIYSKLSPESELTTENLRILVVTICDYLTGLQTNCKTSYKQFESHIEAQIQKQLYEFIYSWVKPLQKGSQGTTPEMAATVMSWGIFGSALQWSHGDKMQSPEELANKLMGLLTGGLSSLTDLNFPKI